MTMTPLEINNNFGAVLVGGLVASLYVVLLFRELCVFHIFQALWRCRCTGGYILQAISTRFASSEAVGKYSSCPSPTVDR